jgi:hypothetical protein
MTIGRTGENMSDEQTAAAEGAVEETVEPKVEDKPNELLFETVGGRKFDLSSEQGRRDLRNFQDGLSYVAGKNAQVAGELQKEVEPLRKYNLKSVTLDEVSILKKIEEHRGQGDHAAADALAIEYTRQIKADAKRETEKERLWSNYKASNQDIFEVLPEDMAKDYVFRTYEKQLEEEKDPEGLIDRVLRPKVAKHIKPRETSIPPAILGKSSVAGAADVKSGIATTTAEKKDQPASEWTKLMREFKVEGY